ncbi:hypothetical protein [Cellulophaga sp. L1A9]|uniref:hypothetical protein n=1 Tax=Cellulophaga sp. L1A9 TaxID=2686362 RepID=UPI00131B3EB6|nr:hypothetical protein [Cellulophaga sp. L1A9]
MATVKSQDSNKLSFRDKLMKIHRFYGVEIVYLEPLINKVQYVIECDYVGYEKSFYYYRVCKKKMYVNSKPLTNVIDVLAEKCMSAVYPLILKVNFAGKIIGVENLNKIKEKWLLLKQKLEIEYTGEVSHKYLERIEYGISNEKIFLKKMNNDIIFKVLIPNIPTLRSQNFIKDNIKIQIPHPNASSKLTFIGKQEIYPYPDDNGFIKISYNGEFMESDLINEPKNTKGNLILKYHLDQEDSSMIRMSGQCTIIGRENHKVEYKITRLKERELVKH